MSPPWLMPMLRWSYFIPCSIHADSNKNECNLFCLDCAGNAFCSYCLVKHKDHRVVQLRTEIVFLNERPQPRIGKGVTNTCEICCRRLLDSVRFCSLGCKIGGMKRGDQNSTFPLRGKHGREYQGGSESDEATTPTKMRRTNAFNRLSFSPGTPPIYNHRNSSRRKGIPHRAPF
ncbi:PLATZ transcription factor family protein [Raphanus sativus]|nr:PLATZ transcription factor family protein [Raphanus sativus]